MERRTTLVWSLIWIAACLVLTGILVMAMDNTHAAQPSTEPQAQPAQPVQQPTNDFWFWMWLFSDRGGDTYVYPSGGGDTFSPGYDTGSENDDGGSIFSPDFGEDSPSYEPDFSDFGSDSPSYEPDFSDFGSDSTSWDEPGW